LFTNQLLKILSQGQQLIDSILASLDSFSPLAARIEEFLRERNIQVNLSLIQETVRDQILSLIGYILANTQVFLTNFFTLILIAVVAFFMLSLFCHSGKTFVTRIVQMSFDIRVLASQLRFDFKN
jgi:predicted PurR-regulated permease PerM